MISTRGKRAGCPPSPAPQLPGEQALLPRNPATWFPPCSLSCSCSCRLRAQGLPWTALMDATLQAAHRELGVQEGDVLAALARTPLHPAVAEVRRNGTTHVA